MFDGKSASWSGERCGDLAPAIQSAIWRGLDNAHLRLRESHDGLGIDTGDAYGNAYLIQNEEIALELEKFIEVVRHHPERARYSLIALPELKLVLTAWKYSDNAKSDVRRAKMKVSQLRKGMLTLTPSADNQLDIAHAAMSDQELAAELTDIDEARRDADLDEQMILIAWAGSHSAGVLRVYWGVAELAGDGSLHWHLIEEIGRPAGNGQAVPTSPALRPIPAASRERVQVPVPELILSPRNPAVAPDGGQPPGPTEDTGSDE